MMIGVGVSSGPPIGSGLYSVSSLYIFCTDDCNLTHASVVPKRAACLIMFPPQRLLPMQVGGYKLPFIVMGTALCMFAVPLAYVMPPKEGLFQQ